MRIVIFGGGGFLGSHLSEKLLDEQNDVIIFDLPSANYLDYSAMLGAEIITGNFLDVYNVRKAIVNSDIVYYLISTTVPKNSNNDPQYDIQTNVIGFLNLLDEVRNMNTIRKIIFPSSGGTVYGIPEKVPIKEDHPTNPICSYGIHKLAIEKYLYLYWILNNLDYCILRIGNAYGERQPTDGTQGVIGAFLRKTIHNEEILIFGDGSNIRDFVYVGDIADALKNAIHYQGTPKIFNIGSGKGHNLNEIAEIITRITEKPSKIKYTANRSFDVPNNVLDISRARNFLEWKPKVDIFEGIKRSYVSMMKQNKH